MLSVMKAATGKELNGEAIGKGYEPKDIIIKRVNTVEEITPEGTLIKRIEKEVNVTRLVNETKKILKQETAIEKIDNITKELLNKGVL